MNKNIAYFAYKQEILAIINTLINRYINILIHYMFRKYTFRYISASILIQIMQRKFRLYDLDKPYLLVKFYFILS